MSDACCEVRPAPVDKRMRNILWIALILNAIMFVVEFSASFAADSVSLKADSIDFLGDAFNYGISLYVLNSVIQRKAIASMLKASSMGIFGCWVIYEAVTNALKGSQPDAKTMSILGLIALAVNLFVAFLLYRYREGDSNMESVWLCTRNDAIGNIAVVIAASGVFLTGTMWPDLIVAAIIGSLGLTACLKVFRKALVEYQGH